MHSGLSNGVPGASQRTYPRKISFWRLMTDHQVLTKEIVEYDYPGSGTKDDPFVVSWLNEDPRNPLQFSMAKKVAITLVTAFATLIVSLTSSAYSGSISDIVRRFEVSTEVATLGLSLFIFGFSVGPLVWAPLSESIGRQIPFFISFLSMAAFLAGCAGARNIQTLLILRFFAGTFGSSPLTNAGGVVSDMFPARQRGLALCLFASTPYMGPALGPMIGGFLSMNAGCETYAPVLLRKRAAKLSRETGKCYLSKLDVGKSPVAWTSRLKTVFSRPWVLLCREPIVLLFTFYASVIYGTLYMLFAAFPIVYEQGRGWNPGVGGYLSWEKYNGFAPPEARLVPCMVSSVTIPIGFFWFAWTNSPSIHWMASVAAMVPFGSGLVLIYLGIVNYLIDSYTIYAASVIAAMSILRYSFGGIFPLFTTYMYEGLGIHWASSIPAFVSVACMPLPFIFYKYGADIRKRCKYAAISAKHLQTIQETAEEEIRRNAVATQPNAAV
ncbi:bicyclomycin resistance protein [Aspergillus bombycis]|uniref:Bicyclomycin resistance protein n=1 Tax=Aspergillus bombycis TaxID=109264 RepID=A0A1F8AB80_9EURO|nr:bicyclomycin resistance protein [Aspergillus bombycis]OGM48705.1 bicyclomycin resistance protein [Aspergillus bombycis]